MFAGVAIGLGVPLHTTFVHTHTVPRYPTAVLATGLMILASLSLTCGLILDTVTRGRREAKILRYLELSGTPHPSRSPRVAGERADQIDDAMTARS